MANCVQETIVAWIKTKIDELVTNEDLAAVTRPVRGGLAVRPQHLLGALYQDDPQPDESTHGAAYWIMPCALDLYVRPADDSTDPVDTTINNLRATAEKKLMEDATCGGNAHLLTIRAPQGFIEGEGFQGTRINFDVQFGTSESDPFTQV